MVKFADALSINSLDVEVLWLKVDATAGFAFCVGNMTLLIPVPAFVLCSYENKEFIISDLLVYSDFVDELAKVLIWLP